MNWKPLLVIAAVALVVRLITLANLLPQLRPDVDRDNYRALARSLAAGKGFVASDAVTGRELPNVARTPVYPLFLAALERLGGDRLALILVAQCFFGAATCALTFLLAARWLPARAAWIAGALVAFDPNSVVRCADLLTEILFTLLLVAGACLLAWRTDKARAWLLGGLLWSVAALTRPIAVWLWVVGLVVVGASVQGGRRRLILTAAFLVGFFPLISLWAVRNAVITGHWFVSTIATYNLLVYRAAGVEAARTGRGLEAVQQEFQTRLGGVEFCAERTQFAQRLQAYRQTARAILTAAPGIAVKQTVVGWAKVLLGPGARSLDNARRQPERAARWWPPLYSVGLAVLLGLSLRGGCRLKRAAWLPGLLALYFVILAGGPESNSRFRLPIMPLLAVLAAAGVSGQLVAPRINPPAPDQAP